MITALARYWAKMRGRRYGKHIWLASGGVFYPLDPHPDEVHIEDIARGLANQCRYNGQIGRGTGYTNYSVAEHSVLVSQYVEEIARERGMLESKVREVALLALLHDAAEAYISDVSRPLKFSREMRGYLKIEHRVEQAVWKHFGLDPTRQMLSLIHEVDDRVLVDEIRALMYPDDTEEDRIARWGEPLECEIQGLRPGLAEMLFMIRYEELTNPQHSPTYVL